MGLFKFENPFKRKKVVSEVVEVTKEGEQPVEKSEAPEYTPVFDTPEKVERVKTRISELIDQIKEEEPDVLFFMDRSARPLSWMLREAWDDETDGKLPAIKFVNIGREKMDVLRGNYDGAPANEYSFEFEDDEGNIDTEKYKKSVDDYWAAFNSDKYIEKVRRDITGKFHDTEDMFGTNLHGNIMIVDDFESSGYSLRTARGFFEKHFPESYIGTYPCFKEEDVKMFGKEDHVGLFLPWKDDKSYTLLAEEEADGVVANPERDPEKLKNALELKKEIKNIFKE